MIGRFSFLALAALPLAAQLPTAVKPCAEMRLHGNPGTTACYEKLTRSTDLAVAAEGYWGIRNYKSANDLFRDAVKAKPKDPALRVRWGYLYLDHWEADMAGDLFSEAMQIDEKYVPALIALAQLAAEGYSSRAIEFSKHAWSWIRKPIRRRK